ncbi:MAG: BspA family leucine-rich repeat surface protein, partial [Saprospirales bacterium]
MAVKTGMTTFLHFIYLLVFICNIHAQRPFITTWQTDLPGVSEDNQILIRGTGFGYTIEWAEVGNPGNTGVETGTGETLITFPHAGTYRVSISGNFTRIQFGFNSDHDKLLSVNQWGDIEWSSMVGAFGNCRNMVIDADDAPDLSGVTSLSGMFFGCINFNSPIGHWDVSNVEMLNLMFAGAISFNQPIGDWNVSNVIDMTSLFNGASRFNQELNSWDVSNVKYMNNMFAHAINFSKPLNDWDVSSVEEMIHMFSGALQFNQPLDQWDVSRVWNMAFMFQGAREFNQQLNDWNVSNLIVMTGMFFSSHKFDQSLDKWELSSSLIVDQMFNFSGMSCENYDSTLIGWYLNPNTPDNLWLGADGLRYRESKAARDSLILKKGWR